MGFTPSSRIVASIDAPLTGNANDWAPAGLHGAEWIRVDADNDYDITGIQAGAHGEQLTITTVNNVLSLINESASSVAANRIAVGWVSVTLYDQCSATLRYDATSARWRVIATTGRLNSA